MTPALYTSPHGYRLSFAESGLDSKRFEELANRGRTELESGQIATATQTFSDALRLWRGPALVDVDLGPVLRSEVLRLDEMRRTALELRIQADLQLGRHHELLAELTSLAAEHPTHEGYQAMLMVALHRVGRRTDALRAYQRMRTRLSSDLGLDPSGKLQRLHSVLLTSDSTLDLPSSATWARPVSQAASTPQPSPHQLPPETPVLIGRDEQLTKALEALATEHRPGPVVALVVGPPGSGTSAFSIRAAHQVSGRYPDGQLYARLVDLDGRPKNAGDVLTEFLTSLGVPESQIPDGADARSRMFLSRTMRKKLLLVLDDVVGVDQLRPLLPAGEECAVLVSCRRRIFTPLVVTTVEIQPLSEADGLRLLSELLGPRRVSADPEAASAIVALCDGLPSALHAVAARLQERPHWSIRRLVDWIGRESAQDIPTADPFGLIASVERTYQTASPTVRAAFRLLIWLEASTLSVPDAANTLGVDERHAESLLEDLVELQILEADHGPGVPGPRYRFLESIRTAGRQLSSDTKPQVTGKWARTPRISARTRSSSSPT
ncbi:BTAD domain-containing putative transcriptional regulator [Amycolatopsis sp. lyj-90]|uniref:BTAD domain-containing putative transcriptional regulator n=1 Tax=Amycolatopsis sp. lyj-90 TaxID=2789285 RepID=UPI00397D6F16